MRYNKLCCSETEFQLLYAYIRYVCSEVIEIFIKCMIPNSEIVFLNWFAISLMNCFGKFSKT